MSAGGNAVVDGLYLEYVEFDRCAATKNAHHDLEAPLLWDHFLHGTDKILEGAIVDLDLVPLRVRDLFDLLDRKSVV